MRRFPVASPSITIKMIYGFARQSGGQVRIYSELKVLFITGYAENAVLNQGHFEPGMHVVTKPFEIAELGRKIRTIISGT